MQASLFLLKSLISQLRDFGLNPTDWHIEEPMHSEFSAIQLQHRVDREFRLVANVSRLTHGRYVMNNLFVSSL